MSQLPNIVYVNIPGLPIQDVQGRFDGEYSLSPFYVTLPKGIMYVSACAKKENVVGQSYLIDYTCELLKPQPYKSVEDFIDGLAANVPFTPDIVAFSCNFTTAHLFLELCAERLKKLWPNSASIVGGHHATSTTKDILKSDAVDYVARGEGEIGFVDFCRAVANDDDPTEIKGIFNATKINALNGACFEACIFYDDLDDLPFPDWDLADMETYMTSDQNRTRAIGDRAEPPRVVMFSSNRGCPFQCTFCASFQVHGRKMRFRSPEKVMEEINEMRSRYGANVFFPDDDLFTANKTHVKTILREFHKQRPDCEMQTPVGLSVNTLDYEMLDLFIETGSTVLTIAVESGSEYVQQHVIKKRCKLDKAIDYVRYLRDRDVIVRVFFIMGFPGETVEQMNETVDYAHTLGADWSGFGIVQPLPGSEAHEQFLEQDIIDDDMESWIESYRHDRQFDTHEVTSGALLELAYRANLMVNFFGNPNKREGKYKKAIALYDEILATHGFHIIGWYCLSECLEAMGEVDKAREIMEGKIRTLIANDDRSAGMYLKYGELMPRLDHAILEPIALSHGLAEAI